MKLKALLVVFSLIFLISAANSLLNVERQAPPTAVTDAGYTVNLVIKPENLTTFDIAEMLPTDWAIENWTVSGNTSKVRYEVLSVPYRGEQKSAYHWRFNQTSEVHLSYTVKPKPGFIGFQTLVNVYTYPGGFDAKEYTLFTSGTVFKTAACGNNICEILFGETQESCPQDCNVQVDIVTIFIVLLIALVVAAIVYVLKRKQATVSYETLKPQEIILEAEATIPRKPKKRKPKTYYHQAVNWFDKIKKSLKS